MKSELTALEMRLFTTFKCKGIFFFFSFFVFLFFNKLFSNLLRALVNQCHHGEVKFFIISFDLC